MASIPQASVPTPCAPLYPPAHAPNALSISFDSILPPAQYWVRSTHHSAPRYAAFSIPHTNNVINTKGGTSNWRLKKWYNGELHDLYRPLNTGWSVG